jgi:hypothetical protein
MPRAAILKTGPTRQRGSQEMAGNGYPAILAIALPGDHSDSASEFFLHP